MNQQTGAIIIAGALIAASIALTNHWTITVLDPSPPSTVLRLNRWTGSVVLCGGLRQPTWEIPCPVEFPPPSPAQSR